MDSSAFNYNPFAIYSDNSCCYSYEECDPFGELEEVTLEADPDADGINGDNGDDEYDPTDTSTACPDGSVWVGGADGGCESIVYGCMDENSDSYDPNANVNDPSMCEELWEGFEEVLGCTDATAFNFNPEATTNDGSCEEVYVGCMDETAMNYNLFANTPCEGCCIPSIQACMDSSMYNYWENEWVGWEGDPPNDDCDGCCVEYIYGCMNENATNYNPLANTSGFGPNDPSDPCIYPEGIAEDSFEITIQNYPGDSDSLDQQ